MASIITSQHGNEYCPQAKFEVTEKSSTGGAVTYNWTLKWVTHGYTVSSSASKAYSAKIDGTTVTSGSFAIGGKTSTTIASGTHTINKGTSSRSVAIELSFAMTFTWSGKSGSTKSASGSFTIPAKTSYTVSYNANGGSGAPSSQTKWYGTNLTLSSSTPSRTGHTFRGWATSASGSVAYAAGATYTANASVTLYAVWTAHTYTVSYNANGGSGAPSAQTKTYGVNLTLSSTRPTRTNYNFLGWSTSASGGVVYNPGSTYTANSGVTLYAVWQLAYVKPRLTNFNAYRSDSAGNASETGTYIKVTFNWSTDYNVSAIVLQWKVQTAGSWTNVSVGGSGKSGTFSYNMGTNFSIETSYHVRAYVSDSGGTTYSSTASIGTVKFPIDVRAGGSGIAFGKVAETAEIADFGWNIRGQWNTESDNRSLNTSPNDYKNTIRWRGLRYSNSIGLSSNTTYGYLLGLRGWADKSGGHSHELAFTDYGIWTRRGASETEWNIWKPIIIGGEAYSTSFNRGSWNSPKSGLVTQIGDNSGSQHSVIVGLKSDGATRAYGIDLLDQDNNPIMALYAGSHCIEIQSAGALWSSGNITASWSLEAKAGYLYSTANGNTVQIGSQNSGYCHIYNSANIPFYFNRDIIINGYYVAKQIAKSVVANTSGNSSYIQIGSLLVCWGKVSITPTANTPTAKAITYPKSFAHTPVVVLTPLTSVPGTTVKGVGVADETYTGCTIYVTRTNDTATSVTWLAIGDV